MLLSIIAALSENRVIGANGSLPWRLPDDMKRFKALTTGHPIVMGRKTFEAIGRRALPGRENIVLSRQDGFSAPGFTIRAGLGEALAPFKDGDREVFIIGGESLFRQALPIADRLCLTLIHERVEGDAFFPHFNKENFAETGRRAGEGAPPHSFIEYERARS